jgi:signal transduction histidine kinase
MKDAPHSLATTTSVELSIEELVQEIKEMAADSRAGLDRIAGIVQALKGMTRNRGEERVVFSPQKVFEEAVLIFRGAKQGCEVNLQMGNLPPICGSSGSLGQVVLNLLENALDSMGGVGTILLEAREFEGKLRMVVKDTGSGISPEISSRIFEPFFTTKENGGTGLGLYICHEIVKQMNGEISFRSSPGDTSFVVDFPLADAAPATKP